VFILSLPPKKEGKSILIHDKTEKRKFCGFFESCRGGFQFVLYYQGVFRHQLLIKSNFCFMSRARCGPKRLKTVPRVQRSDRNIFNFLLMFCYENEILCVLISGLYFFSVALPRPRRINYILLHPLGCECGV
jgi:hypothetical protein